MARDERKKVKGDVEDSEPTLDWLSPSLEETNEKASDKLLERDQTRNEVEPFDGFKLMTVPRTWGTASYDEVTEEETATAYVYKMDKPWLTADEVRVEIRRGRALWLIGRGDETVKVNLQRNNEMRLREATASLSPDGVLTVVIPKRHRPRKWREYADLVFMWFETVRVGVAG